MTSKESPADIVSSEIYRFWEERSKRFSGKNLVNLSNLEENPELAARKHVEEQDVLLDYLSLKKTDVVLDLGAGHCAWSVVISGYVAHVDAVEYSAGMFQLAKQNIAMQQITNVTVYHSSAQDFNSASRYDVVLLSGLTIYLSDDDLHLLLAKMQEYVRPGGRVVLRDGTGRHGPYIVLNRYSNELGSYYSAYYRSVQQYIEFFAVYGFKLLRHRDMFPIGSPFNKRLETVLRVYEFIKSEKEK